jgi:hypothetical protein
MGIQAAYTVIVDIIGIDIERDTRPRRLATRVGLATATRTFILPI